MNDPITTSSPATPPRGFFRHTLVAALLGLATVAACAGLPMMPGGLGGGGQATTRSTSTTSREEHHTVNGREVAPDDGRRENKQAGPSGADFGATCTKNSDCASNTCFVGAGELGYCTRMCDSFSDCPSFWECERAGNAPQRICQQDAD